MDVTATQPYRWGAGGQWDYITRPWQVLLPHLVCCSPGAEAERGSAGPGLSVSPRPVQGQGQGQGQEEGVGLGCGLLPTRPEFPMGLFLQRRSHYLEDTRQLSHYEALLFCPFRESM